MVRNTGTLGVEIAGVFEPDPDNVRNFKVVVVSLAMSTGSYCSNHGRQL